MNCEQATQLVSLSCEQKLALTERVRLQVHLWICPKCQHFKDNNDKLRQMLKKYCQQDEKKG